MFKRIKLSNFRQHEDREWFFVPGLNVIRGVNEAGKTTMLEGAAYVMFGAKTALREPIDNVVTYGKKVSALKAEVDMEVGGTTYTGKRSKAGAEVWIAGGLKPVVVGQDECTKFWESLLGVSAKVASNLMLANQVSIRGALSQGPSAPMVLIEKLANLGLIDQIITLVTAEIPTGHTKQTVERIAELEERLKEAEGATVDLVPLRAAELATQIAMSDATASRNLAQQTCDAHRPAADKAQRVKNELQQIAISYGESVNSVRFAEVALASIAVPPQPDMARLAALRQQVEDAKSFNKALDARKALDALTDGDEWEGTFASLQSEIEVWDEKARVAISSRHEAQRMLAREEAMLITETACGLCGKDLSEVPEVASKNAATQGRITELRAKIATLDADVDEATRSLADLRAVESAAVLHDRVYDRCREFVTLDQSYAPSRWTWIGPDVTKPPVNPAAEIMQIEAAQRAYDQAAGAKTQAEENLKTATARRDALKVEQDAAKVLADAGEPDLLRAVELAEALAAAESTLRTAREAHQKASGALATAEAVQAERIAAHERLKADLQDERDNLTEIEQGNKLLGKLRSARPQIADKLWKMVLTSVSTYFSSGRGKTSVVTRADNGFLVDGQSIDGLSGSTLDTLGLAIRIALVKTFLPNCGFMVLDEPAAACDDGRETNLLALVATVGFEQVLLVTHSDLSDAFAQQVIQL